MLKILGLSLFALVVLSVLIAMAVVNIRGHLAPKRNPPTPDEARGPFTRPEAPANPSPIEYNRTDHTHMRSGTIFENINPEHEGRTPVRSDPLTSRPPRLRSRDGDPFDTIQQSMEEVGRSMNDVSRALHGVLSGGGPMAPGVEIRVTHTVETTQAQRDREDREREEQALKPRQTPKQSKAQPPVVKRKDRYHRDPVV